MVKMFLEVKFYNGLAVQTQTNNNFQTCWHCVVMCIYRSGCWFVKGWLYCTCILRHASWKISLSTKMIWTFLILSYYNCVFFLSHSRKSGWIRKSGHPSSCIWICTRRKGKSWGQTSWGFQFNSILSFWCYLGRFYSTSLFSLPSNSRKCIQRAILSIYQYDCKNKQKNVIDDKKPSLFFYTQFDAQNAGNSV